MKKRRVLFSVLISVGLLSSLAAANGLNLNSLGTRALAMGGAFVGLADDFSAIYWNPAGMALFQKKYFGFFGTDLIPSSKYRMDVDVPPVITLVNARTETKHYLTGLAAYYHPVSEKVVVGFGVYVPSGLGALWDGTDFALLSVQAGLPPNPTINWMSKIGMVTFSPALAIKVNDKLSLGATFNINYAIFDISMWAGASDPPMPLVDLGQYEESMTGWGYGATLGVLFKPVEKLSLGATFRSASTVGFKGEATISGMTDLGAAMVPPTPLNDTSDLEREVTWPMWLAGGVAFRPIEDLTLTADLQWTQWSKIDVMDTVYVDPFWAAMMEQSGDDARPMHWEDALQIRIGAEYKINSLAFRAGYYYDPSPAPDRTMNVLLPNFDFNVITAGFGTHLNGLQLDFGIEYLMGKERNVPVERVATDPDWETAQPGVYNMNIIVPTISVSYKF
jgi:long-chain fatty acid transport protein